MDPIVAGKGVVLVGEAAQSFVTLLWIKTLVGYGVTILIGYVVYQNWASVKKFFKDRFDM